MSIASRVLSLSRAAFSRWIPFEVSITSRGVDSLKGVNLFLQGSIFKSVDPQRVDHFKLSKGSTPSKKSNTCERIDTTGLTLFDNLKRINSKNLIDFFPGCLIFKGVDHLWVGSLKGVILFQGIVAKLFDVDPFKASCVDSVKTLQTCRSLQVSIFGCGFPSEVWITSGCRILSGSGFVSLQRCRSLQGCRLFDTLKGSHP